MILVDTFTPAARQHAAELAKRLAASGRSAAAIDMADILSPVSVPVVGRHDLKDGLERALGTITAGGPHHGVVSPYLVDKGHTHAGDQRARSALPLRQTNHKPSNATAR